MKEKIKKHYRFTLYIFLILFIISFIVFFINTNYKYLVGNDLLNDTQVILDGEIKADEVPEVKIDSNNLFGPFRNMKVSVDDLNGINYIYNVFKFSGFTPYETYEVNFDFKILGLDTTTKLIIGSQEEKGLNYIDQEDGTIMLNNIDLEDPISFSRGYSDYVSIPLILKANEDGDVYIVVGIEVDQKKVLDYELSQVRLRI